MATNTDTTLKGLQARMAVLQPGAIEDKVERAAPAAAKMLGYVDLVQAALPDLIRMITQARSTQPEAVAKAGCRAVAAVPAVATSWWERLGNWSPPSLPSFGAPVVAVPSKSRRSRGLMVVLPLVAGVVAYAAWYDARRRRG